MRALLQFVRALLGELSDQTAYQRHLEAHAATHSGAEWRRFCDERWQAKATRGSCC
jgi:hypothetical protein